MELRQIQYFIEVARREHVTEAALALHVAQSAVSRQLFNLESELGVDLFIREGRNVRLTSIGKVFLEHMEQAMKVIENGKREVEEYLDPEKGTVRIGFPSSLAHYTLPSVISAFRGKYPSVKFDLHQGSYHSLAENVVKGNIDMAILGPLPKLEKVKGDVLFTEKIVALLPYNHRLAGEKEIKLGQLQNEPFILFPKGYVLRNIIEKAFQQIGYNPVVSFEGEDIDTIKGLVSAGLGITLIPEITLIDGTPRSTVMIPVIEPSVSRAVGVIIPRDRKLLPTEQLFYQFLKDFFYILDSFQR